MALVVTTSRGWEEAAGVSTMPCAVSDEEVGAGGGGGGASVVEAATGASVGVTGAGVGSDGASPSVTVT